MTTTNDVKWGSYSQWEGPLFWGSAPVTASADPSDAEKMLLVVTATEGSRWDAVNMYDRCILSVGSVQWCEASMYGVSDMLGEVYKKDPTLLTPLDAVMKATGAWWQLNSKGRFRFYTPSGEVDTLPEQQALFLLHSNGLKGTWDEDSKALAKLWVASMANVFQQKGAQEAQANFTVPRLRGFATKEAKAILWGTDEALPNDAWVGAIRAAFLSFAANLPAVAAKQLQKAVGDTKATKWSPEWCVAILKQLTFGPGIAIYPHRYEAIRPRIEQLYGVDLPDFAPDLQAWHEEMGVDPASTAPSFTTVQEYQALLLAEGYDLGPAGADGKDGPKTRDAVRVFQGLHGLTADGIVGAQTRAAFATEWRKRNG
jgi:hypothetical protein